MHVAGYPSQFLVGGPASEEQNEGRLFVAATCSRSSGAEKSSALMKPVVSARYRAAMRGSPLRYKCCVSNVQQRKSELVVARL